MAGGTRDIGTGVGQYQPKMHATGGLPAGQVGYLLDGIKTLADLRVGDTVTHAANPAPKALAGYEAPRQMVFCDFYPSSGGGEGGKKNDFEELREAIEKLSLNDASFTFIPQHSEALGSGFRSGSHSSRPR